MNRDFLHWYIWWFSKFHSAFCILHFEKSSNMVKIWPKMKKFIVLHFKVFRIFVWIGSSVLMLDFASWIHDPIMTSIMTYSISALIALALSSRDFGKVSSMRNFNYSTKYFLIENCEYNREIESGPKKNRLAIGIIIIAHHKI